MIKKRFFSIFFVLTLLASLMPAPRALALDQPDIQAKAALLMDYRTDTVVYAKNEHQELYPASLTKIMTALLVLEAVDGGKLSMEKEITASASAMEGLAADGSTANIKEGETLTVRNLLYCMMVVSANEACNILAEEVSGSVDAFVAAMNAKAKELGCKNTHFMNPNGLQDTQHYTSAWDLYLIVTAAMKHPDFMTICDTANVIIPATNMSGERNYWTTNHLLSTWRVKGYRNTDAHGIKTGSTSQAGLCLVSSAERGTLHFVSVVLGAERTEENGVGNLRSFSETTALFNYGFDNFVYKTAVSPSTVVEKEIPVTLSKLDHVTIHPAKEIELLLPRDLDPADMEHIIDLKAQTLEAPVHEGEVLGTLTLRYQGRDYATVDLLAMHDVEASGLLVFWRDVQVFFSGTAVRLVCALLAALAVLFVLWRLIFSHRRYRYGRSVGRKSGGYRGRRR